MKKLAFIAPVLFALPLVASAQQLTPLATLISSIGHLVGMVVPILITIALIVFFWGLIKYIRSSGEGHGEGKNIMIAGLVSLFVMVSVWGIILLAQGALGVNPNAPVQSPGVPVPGSSGYTGTGYSPY